MNLTQAIKKLIKYKNYPTIINSLKRESWEENQFVKFDNESTIYSLSLNVEDFIANDWIIIKPKKSLKIIEKCQSCHVNEGESDHTCPYSEDINDDHETLCNCCSDCRYNCLMKM